LAEISSADAAIMMRIRAAESAINPTLGRARLLHAPPVLSQAIFKAACLGILLHTFSQAKNVIFCILQKKNVIFYLHYQWCWGSALSSHI
jgi:hypothetical protein